jgi:ABC-type multidrug transport system fused ATPase/permease subunit
MNNKFFFKKIASFFRPFRFYLTIIVSLLILIQLIGTLSPYLFGKAVDAVIHNDARLAFTFIGISFGVSLLQSVFLWWGKESFELKHLDDHIEKTLSVESLSKNFEYSIGQHTNEHSGVKQNVITKGQSSLENLMYSILYNILPAGLQALVTLIVLVIFDWKIALIALVFTAVYIDISLRRNRKFFPVIESIRKKNQSQGKLSSELYRNSTLVISEGQEAKTVADFDVSATETANFSTSGWLGFLKPFYLHKIVIVAGQYVTLALGVYLILIGKHSAGMFVALFSWTSSIFGNLQMIMNTQRQMLFQMVEIKKMFDLFDIKPDIDPNKNGVALEKLEGKIEFKNISFAYPYRKSAKEEEDEIEISDKKEEHTVSQINLVIPSGAKVGFVGVSGSGKSTIVNLMRRFYDPTEGEILIDDVPLKEINLHWLRSRIGNVEQKIDLFDRSIKDNILFGLPANADVPEEKLQKAVEDASLTEFVEKLKDHGLDTVIGEGGIKVSGGERQRIGIARALIKDPKILIFDEATSALDSINEKLIHDAINRSAQGRTTIIIAHRLSTVMDADIIFVVAKGKIVAQGTHKELEKSSEDYKELIKNQILMG